VGSGILVFSYEFSEFRQEVGSLDGGDGEIGEIVEAGRRECGRISSEQLELLTGG
jgi:hypothetical protein